MEIDFTRYTSVIRMRVLACLISFRTRVMLLVLDVLVIYCVCEKDDSHHLTRVQVVRKR